MDKELDKKPKKKPIIIVPRKQNEYSIDIPSKNSKKTTNTNQGKESLVRNIDDEDEWEELLRAKYKMLIIEVHNTEVQKKKLSILFHCVKYYYNRSSCSFLKGLLWMGRMLYCNDKLSQENKS